jgi:hypothetical protein
MRKALAALIAAVAAIQVYLAHRYYGFLGGDDVEVLEEAFRRVFGTNHSPWNIRSLFVPDTIVAPVIYIANAMGVSDRRTLIEIASLPFIALSALTAFLVYRLAMRWIGDARAAFVAALLFALHWIPLGFGSTVYPRTLATACIVGAALIVERYPFVAGLLVALAFADRFSELIFLAPIFIGTPASAGRPAGFSRPRVLLGALLGVLALGGGYDWLTWGAPFQSLRNFAHLTVVEPDFASRVKYQPAFWYFANILRWCAPTLLILIAIGRRNVRWWFLAIPLIALSIVRHKEFRYLQAMIPFLAIAGAAGFAVLWQSGRRYLAASLVAVSVFWNLAGVRLFQRKTMPAVMAAQAMDRDSSIHTIAVPQAWALGGQLYFHRDVKLIEIGTPSREVPVADALVLYRSELDDPQLAANVKRAGFVPQQVFSDPPARVVVFFTRSASGTSDPARQ